MCLNTARIVGEGLRIEGASYRSNDPDGWTMPPLIEANPLRTVENTAALRVESMLSSLLSRFAAFQMLSSSAEPTGAFQPTTNFRISASLAYYVLGPFQYQWRSTSGKIFLQHSLKETNLN